MTSSNIGQMPHSGIQPKKIIGNIQKVNSRIAPTQGFYVHLRKCKYHPKLHWA